MNEVFAVLLNPDQDVAGTEEGALNLADGVVVSDGFVDDLDEIGTNSASDDILGSRLWN